MMKTIYNAFYLSIFLHFLRVFLAKFILRGNGMYNLYIEGCERKGKTFHILVISTGNFGMLRRMANYLDELRWATTTAMDGSFIPSESGEIIPINDPILKDLFDRHDYLEITGVLKLAD